MRQPIDDHLRLSHRVRLLLRLHHDHGRQLEHRQQHQQQQQQRQRQRQHERQRGKEEEAKKEEERRFSDRELGYAFAFG